MGYFYAEAAERLARYASLIANPRLVPPRSAGAKVKAGCETDFKRLRCETPS
jgi:hypothetical protein